MGVTHQLAGISNLKKQTVEYGFAFEHFIGLELSAYISYKRLHQPLSYWRSKHGAEVDFIIGDEIAIEVKATEQVGEKHLKGIKCLQEEKICNHYFLVSQDPINRKTKDCHIIHWRDFLSKLWQGTLI